LFQTRKRAAFEASNFFEGEARHTFQLMKSTYRVYILGRKAENSDTLVICTSAGDFTLELPDDCRETYLQITLDEDVDVEMVMKPNILNVVIRDEVGDVLCYSPRILTIVPLYNCASYIERAIHSLNMQTLKPSKICIIDDCSTDSSIEIARSVSSGIPIDFFQSRIPLGPFLCKNIALHAFRDAFEFVTFLDSDDLILHNTYRYLSDVIRLNSEPSAVYPNFIRIDKGTPRVFPPHPIHKNQHRECFAGMFAHTSFFDRVGYFDCVRYGADGELNARCENVGKPIFSTNAAPLYFAESRGGSLTQAQGQKVELDDTREGRSWLSKDRYLYAQRFPTSREPKSVFNVPRDIPESMRIFKYADIEMQNSYFTIESAMMHRSFFLDMSVSGRTFTNLWRKL